MVTFSSRRERRSWVLALSVLAIIYATLGVAGELAAELRNRGLFDAVFGAGFVATVIVIAVHGLRSRPSRLEVAAVVGVVAAFAMALSRVAIPEERTHLFEYAVLGVLVHEAVTERARNRGIPRHPVGVAMGLTAAAGLVDECIQAALPSRVFDGRDIAFNIGAGTFAIAAVAGLRRLRASRLRRSGGGA